MGDPNKKLNGFGGLASAAGNVVSTGISAIAQHYENKAAREHNLKLAQMQNQWNIEQWERNNTYNSPENQVARLKAAGLNPDLLYGGGVQNTSTSSPQMTSGAPRTPTDWSSLANINPVGSYLDAQLKQAQIDNINADTKKKGHEAGILASDEAFRDAWNQGLIQTQNIEIQIGESQRDLNQAGVKTELAKVQNLEALTSQANASVEKIYNDIKNDNSRINLEKSLNDATCKEIAARTNTEVEKVKQMRDSWNYIIQNYEDEHSINLETGKLIKEQAENEKTEGDILTIKKGVVQFKSNVIKGKKRDLTLAEQNMRINDELLKAVVSSF